MNNFYRIKENNDNIHIIISNKGYGKTYYEKNKYKRELLNNIIAKIKHEIVTDCIDEEYKGKLLTIIETIRWDI